MWSVIGLILVVAYMAFNLLRAMRLMIDGEEDVVVGLNVLFGFFIFLYEQIRDLIEGQ